MLWAEQSKGFNANYPKSVEIWEPTTPVPEWLSDQAKVNFLDGEGNITLEKSETSTGDIDILKPGGGVLVRIKGGNLGLVLYDPITKRIFSLTREQFELLYEIKKRRGN